MLVWANIWSLALREFQPAIRDSRSIGLNFQRRAGRRSAIETQFLFSSFTNKNASNFEKNDAESDQLSQIQDRNFMNFVPPASSVRNPITRSTTARFCTISIEETISPA